MEKLFEYILYKGSDEISSLLEMDELKDGINEPDEDGRTLLIWAVYYNKLDMVRALLENGADIDACDKTGKTALMWASFLGRDKEIVKELLDKGASVSKKDKNENTALMFAANLGNSSIVKELAARVDDEDEKHIAFLLSVIEGHLEVVKVLTKVDINREDQEGYTALMYAAIYGNLELVRYLIDNGASIDKQNKDGNTALMFGTLAGNLEIVKCLVENEASIDKQNKEGKTVFAQAVEKKVRNDILEYLFSKKLEKQLTEDEKERLTEYVIRAKNTKLFVMLLEKMDIKAYLDKNIKLIDELICGYVSNEKVINALIEKGLDIKKLSYFEDYVASFIKVGISRLDDPKEAYNILNESLKQKDIAKDIMSRNVVRIDIRKKKQYYVVILRKNKKGYKRYICRQMNGMYKFTEKDKRKKFLLLLPIFVIRKMFNKIYIRFVMKEYKYVELRETANSSLFPHL